MDISAMIDVLPPFERKRDVIVYGRQTVKQIVTEVLNAHDRYADDYDQLVDFFQGNAPRKLFDFCKQYLSYKEEPDTDQTTKSPAALLQSNTNDCKHYACFIGGVLDALNRTGEYDYDWSYRFVNYKQGKKQADHVFVVVDHDLWIDPTPIRKSDGSGYVDRWYNDRLMEPANYKDLKPSKMLSSLHGVHYTVDYIDQIDHGSCMGQLPTTSTTSTASNFQNVANQVPEAQAAITAANSVADQLPDGALKDWVKSFLADPQSAIMSLIFGRTYTSGDYRAGEYYMRNILGMMEIQRQGQVPDSYVPQAWSFWTLAMGVPIHSWDDMDALDTGWNIYQERDNLTLNWVPNNQAERAEIILRDHIGWRPGYQPRDQVWPLSKFGEIPYIYPIYDVYDPKLGQRLYTGTHPITGLNIVNGYPSDAVTTPPSQVTPPGQTVDTTNDNTPPPVTKAGFGWLPVLLVGGIAWAALSGQNKHHG